MINRQPFLMYSFSHLKAVIEANGMVPDYSSPEGSEKRGGQ